MLAKGDKVQVKEYQRTRTIFVNADVTPGETTTYKGGWIGTVTSLLEDDQVEVHKDSKNEDDGWYYFSESELEKLSPRMIRYHELLKRQREINKFFNVTYGGPDVNESYFIEQPAEIAQKSREWLAERERNGDEMWKLQHEMTDEEFEKTL